MFKFIHTADWQLGKSFSSFDGDLPALLRNARVDVIRKIADAARAFGTSHVLVAGDVWEHEFPSDATIKQPLDILSACDDLTWMLLPGNHDPVRPNNLWDRLLRFGPPANVHPLLEPAPYRIREDVYVLPAPWTSKAPGRDQTIWMNSAETPPDALRIGLAHGSVVEFSGDASQSAAISDARASEAALDYLALGDWHGKQEVSRNVWYSGTPEPDRFKNNDPGWCLGVEVFGPGIEAAVTPIQTKTFHWLQSEIDVTSVDEPSDAMTTVIPDGLSRRETLMRLRLTGLCNLSQRSRWQARLSEVAASLAHLDVDWSNLQRLHRADDLDSIDQGGSLRRTADELSRMVDDTSLDLDRRGQAQHALDLLFTWVVDEDSEDA